MVLHRYKPAENAFMINYADYCIAHKLDYVTKVAAAFEQKFKRETHWNKLKYQVPKILKSVFGVPKPSLPVFKKEGTRCIDKDNIANVPDDFLSVMNNQRKKMRLKKLEAREGTEDSADDWENRDVEEGEDSSTPTTSGTDDDTETIDHGDVGSPNNPMRIEESPEATGSQQTAGNSDVLTADSTTATVSAPTGDTKRTGVATKKTVEDTSAVILDIVSPIHRPTPSPISPSAVRAGVSEKVLGKRKATEALVDDTSLSKRLDLRRPEDSLDERSGVETTGHVNVLSGKKPNQGYTVNEARIALQLACALYRTVLDSGKDIPHDLFGTIMQKVQRIPNFTEDDMFDMALKDAESQRKLKEKSEDMVATLVGELEYNTKTIFPKTPSHEDVNRDWRAFQQHVMYTAGHNSSTPTPRLGAAGYLSRSVEAIADGRVSADDLDNDIGALRDCLVSPHAHQALLSALVCRWVFNSPEAMSKGHHSVPVVKILEAAKCSGGLQQVQRIDKLMTQQMFMDPDHQSVIASRERLFCQDFTKAAQTLCKPHELQPPPIERLASAAIVLKHKLMLSPDDYRIHYCRPETLFDPVWMQAVGAKNFPIVDAAAMGKEITLCMFPALMSQKPEAFGEDATIKDALVMNKKFFPTSDEKRSFDPSLCLSKATVLVLL